MQLIVTEDLTDEALAIRLGCSPSAIRTQLDRLRHKLGLHSGAAIVATAWRAWMGMEPIDSR
jgi:DNA-binding CsgD family transcriptional regulator